MKLDQSMSKITMSQKEYREKFKKEKLLLEPFLNNNYITSYNDSQLECYMDAMKEYAEYYAIKCLQLAAKSVKSEQVMNIQQGYEPFSETRIDKDSILNIKLPDHD